MKETPTSADPVPGGCRGIANWKWLAALAAVFATLGGVSLFTTLSSHALHATLLGSLLQTGGMLQFWQAVQGHLKANNQRRQAQRDSRG